MPANGDAGHCSAADGQEAGAEKRREERKCSSICRGCLHGDVEAEEDAQVRGCLLWAACACVRVSLDALAIPAITGPKEAAWPQTPGSPWPPAEPLHERHVE